jgi:hypothetical protein
MAEFKHFKHFNGMTFRKGIPLEADGCPLGGEIEPLIGDSCPGWDCDDCGWDIWCCAHNYDHPWCSSGKDFDIGVT